MRSLRELLAWALGRLALHPQTWVELEGFLVELHAVVRRRYWSYGGGTRLSLSFDGVEGRAALPGGVERERAYWLAQQGQNVGNMVLVTLVHFGLVERGVVAGSARWVFRLTPAGREVFGAPDVEPVAPTAPSSGSGRPLIVQADFEVLLHVDDSDPATRTRLAQLATMVAAGERVSRYRLEAASIRGAVEAGMTAEGIVSFLAGASRTELPKAVVIAIGEWCERETVRLHGPGFLIADAAGARVARPAAASRAARALARWNLDHGAQGGAHVPSHRRRGGRDAIASSPRFRSLGVERLAPGYLRVDVANLDDIARELAELGVDLAIESEKERW